MQPDQPSPFEHQLERALKSLPLNPAPPSLLPRVLAEIVRRSSLPWYRCAWDVWPRGVQIASLVALTALAIGLFYSGWELILPGTVALGEKLATVFGVLEALGSACRALIRAVPGWLLLLNPKILIAAAVLMFAMLGGCLGIGTVYYRFAFVRR